MLHILQVRINQIHQGEAVINMIFIVKEDSKMTRVYFRTEVRVWIELRVNVRKSRAGSVVS